MKRRGLIWVTSALGAGLGIFWLFAIDAGRNYALWSAESGLMVFARNASLVVLGTP
jgi:hypothetical protein